MPCEALPDVQPTACCCRRTTITLITCNVVILHKGPCLYAMVC